MKLTLEEAQNKMLEAFKRLPLAEKQRLIEEVEQRLTVKTPLDKPVTPVVESAGKSI